MFVLGPGVSAPRGEVWQQYQHQHDTHQKTKHGGVDPGRSSQVDGSGGDTDVDG